MEKIDGRSKLSKLIELVKEHEGQRLPVMKLRGLIRVNIGASERVVNETLKGMLELGMIREVEHLIFQVVKNWKLE